MKKILVIYGVEPILDIDENDNMGLHRDRNPDAGWGQLRRTRMEGDRIKEVELDDKLRQILLEDLAFTYGQHSRDFTDKLVEFGLFQSESYKSIKVE
jgi:hypothetical protein